MKQFFGQLFEDYTSKIDCDIISLSSNLLDTLKIILENMKVLKLNQQFSTLIGVCSLREQSGWRMKIMQKLCTVSFLAGLLAYGGTSVLYAEEHLRLGNIQNSLFALIQVSAALSMFTSSISLSLRKKGLRNFFDRAQANFDECIHIFRKS